jgi:hypothetical protein
VAQIDKKNSHHKSYVGKRHLSMSIDSFPHRIMFSSLSKFLV